MIINKVETRRGITHPHSVYFIVVAGILGIGILLGYLMFGPRPADKPGNTRIALTAQDCDNIVMRIQNITSNFDSRSSDTQVAMVNELNNMYIANCRGRFVPPAAPMPKSENTAASQPLPDRTCEAIEVLKKQGLAPGDAHDWQLHIMNARIYSDLFKFGCPENLDTFKGLAIRELDIAHALLGGDADSNSSYRWGADYINTQLGAAAP